MSDNRLPAQLLGSLCPTPLNDRQQIVLGHGSGGKLTSQLLESIFLRAFRNDVLERLDDQAVLQIGPTRLAFTTDSFVVTPLSSPAATSASWRFMAQLTIWRSAGPGHCMLPQPSFWRKDWSSKNSSELSNPCARPRLTPACSLLPATPR